MYFPYFRGKQYELIAIRESAGLFAEANFVPIIEPVKESLSGLRRAVDAIDEAAAQAVLIVNPGYGDHAADPQAIHSLFFQDLQEHRTVSVGIALREDVELRDATRLMDAYDERHVTFIHAGFSEGRRLAEQLRRHGGSFRHVFVEEHCGKLYQRHFRGPERILLRDGFQRRTNREYPYTEFFSDIHVTYEDEGVDGFGDFLIVGDDYSESGGPAYAVAIHMTYIDSQRDDEMHIFHFVSDRQDTPTDPAGKFGEALVKLTAEVNRPGTSIIRTSAVDEFVDLNNRGHYPGLGSVKKLSMLHHIQTLASYFGSR